MGEGRSITKPSIAFKHISSHKLYSILSQQSKTKDQVVVLPHIQSGPKLKSILKKKEQNSLCVQQLHAYQKHGSLLPLRATGSEGESGEEVIPSLIKKRGEGKSL